MATTGYTFDVLLNPSDLDYLNALGQQIVFVRSMQQDSTYATVCAVFLPFTQKTTVQFGLGWYLFAVPPPAAFAVLPIQPSTSSAVALGNSYIFSAGEFGQQETAYSRQVLGCTNHATGSVPIGFGVAQIVTIGGAAATLPQAVLTIPATETGYLEPLAEVKVFLASGLQPGQVIPLDLLQPNGKGGGQKRSSLIVGTYLRFDLTQGGSLTFDQTTNSFNQVTGGVHIL